MPSLGPLSPRILSFSARTAQWREHSAAVDESADAEWRATDAGGVGRARSERDRIVYEMREAGHTLQTIGDAIGVTRERVRQLLKRRGGGREMVLRSRRDGHRNDE